jgi:hypothetical protein
MVDDRLNSCGRFRRGQCRHQDEMARLYLIPQVLDPKRLGEYQKTCLSCRDYLLWSAGGRCPRPLYADRAPANFFLDGVLLPGSLQPETAYF